MSAQPIEWVLLVRYGSSAHRATYGRLTGSTKYTKDYLQLSKRQDFIDDLEIAFPALGEGNSFVPITYCWPTGSANGKIFGLSADRPHLAWETNSAPEAWRMSGHPTSSSAETIRGNPSHTSEGAADLEHRRLLSSGFGQPFLVAVKLKGEANTLHLSVLIENPEQQFTWADLNSAPPEIQQLAAATSGRQAFAWRLFTREEGSRKLYFDPSRKADPWSGVEGVTSKRRETTEPQSGPQRLPQSSDLDSDQIAEGLDYSEEEAADFERRLDSGNYEVSDSFATTKTRGSAQKAFASEVKKNYGWRCALTGIETREFLIASHIVPWSVDENIRLDPSNGICFSVLIDRAFENGVLIIQDDLTVTIDWERIGGDAELTKQLGRYDGKKLNLPKAHPPKPDYLRRRRDL